MLSDVDVPAMFVALQEYKPASLLLIGFKVKIFVFLMIALEALIHVISAAGCELEEQLMFSTPPSVKVTLVVLGSNSGFAMSTKNNYFFHIKALL